MKKNDYIELKDSLSSILSSRQKKLMKTLAIFMMLGMFLEIFFLQNLLVLLNYLSNSYDNTPVFVKKIGEFIDLEKETYLILFLFICTFLIKTLFSIFLKFKESNFIFNLKAEISERLFLGYLNLPLIFHQRTNTAKLLKNITFEVDQFSILIFALTTFFLEFIVLVGISIYLLNFNFYISLFCILSFFLFGYFFNAFNKKKLKVMSMQRLKHQDDRIKSIIEGLGGLREIKLWSKENNIFKRFSYHNNFLANISISTSLRNALTKPAFEIFLILVISIFLFIFIARDSLNSSTIPTLGIYLAAAYRLLPSIAKIVQSIQSFQFNQKCAKNLNDDVQKFKNKSDGKNVVKKSLNFENFIKVKDLNFSYENTDLNNTLVLKGVNLEINKGDCVGLQGESGSGKSTLIDLIIGLQSPSQGEILVDQSNIKDNLKDWQNLIGCVPQEVFILDDTLKKNIAFGVAENEISINKIRKSLKLSNLEAFVESLDNNIDTIIGEKGSRLSGGQKQRIGIARALYNDPKIIIFDESTNALDIETEKKIILEIKKFKREKTMIIISHKKETLDFCDYIYKIENGKLSKNV